MDFVISEHNNPYTLQAKKRLNTRMEKGTVQGHLSSVRQIKD